MKHKFVVLSNPRTGSEYLVRLLNQHPEIQCHGEVFAIPPGEGIWNTSEYKLNMQPFEFLSFLKNNTLKLIFGYKQISNWFSNSGFKNEDDFIEQSHREGYSIIFIERLCLLKEYVSFMLMIEQNYGHIQNESKQTKRIKLNPLQAYAQMRKWDAFNNACQAALANRNIPYLHLVYENDFDDRKLVKNRTFDFLEVNRVELLDPLKRTNTGSLKDIIINFDEIANFLIEKNRFLDGLKL